MSTIAHPAAPPRRLGRSIAAMAIGFISVAVVSLATDQILHVLKVYPPWGQPMHDPALNALALTYRVIYTILGCWLTARLAPRRPMLHAMIVGAIGFVLSTAGAIVAITQYDLGPSWYPIALAASSLPCAWLGAKLHR
ncbi:MAG TPA: hypothetical protein VFP80_10285 [Thermoanaerobaculia bacterium]|nr:hypothetical protein [Thermoanaerobaculia bacterium]